MQILTFLAQHKQCSDIVLILDSIKSWLIASALEFVPFQKSKTKHSEKPTQSASRVSTWSLFILQYALYVCFRLNFVKLK